MWEIKSKVVNSLLTLWFFKLCLFSKTLSVSDHYPVEVELKTHENDTGVPSKTTETKRKTPKKGIICPAPADYIITQLLFHGLNETRPISAKNIFILL